MGLYGNTKSSSSGSLYGGGGSSPAPKAHGVLGFIGNLAGDVRNAAVGLPAGLIGLAEHPIRGLGTMGKATWQDWSPLFHGHVGQWAHNVYDHPLAPILDVAGLLTGGGALAAKGGEALASLGAISQDSRLALLGRGGQIAYHAPADRLAEAADAGHVMPPTMAKYASNNPMVRMRQLVIHNLSGHLESQLPSWYAKSVGTVGKYNRREATQRIMRANTLQGLQVKQLADSAQAEAMYHAGKLIHSADSGQLAPTWGSTSLQLLQRSIFQFNHGNVARHAFHVADNGGKKAPRGFTFVQRSPLGGTSEDFLKHLQDSQGVLTPIENKYYAATKGDTFEAQLHDGLPPMITTHLASRAMRDAQGNLLVVPSRDISHIAKEAAGSAKVLKSLYLNPFRMWKRLQIGYSPKTVMNVSVGNMLMLMADQGGASLARGLYHMVKADRGAKFANDGIRNLTHNMPMIEQHFGHVINSTQADELAKDTGIVGGVTSKGVRKVIREGVYPLVHKSEQTTKRWQIHAELRSAPEVKALMRQGKSFQDAAQQALTADHHLGERISQKVLHTGGDYTHLSPGEKMVRNIVPFYSWDKHMLSHATQLLTDRAHVAAPLAAAGTMGTNNTVKELGGTVPDFLKSAIPLSMLGIHRGTGRIGIIQGSGLNPYSTGADITDLVRQLTVGGTIHPGEAIAGQLNPLLTHGVEQISGHAIGTDAAVKRHGGFIPSIVADTVLGLPEVKIGMSAFNTPQPKPNARTGVTTPFLYKKDLQTNVASWLGVPVKQVDPTALAAQAKKQNDLINPPKKKKKTTLFG